MYLCTCICVYRGQRRTSGVPLYQSPPCFLERGSLAEPEVYREQTSKILHLRFTVLGLGTCVATAGFLSCELLSQTPCACTRARTHWTLPPAPTLIFKRPCLLPHPPTHPFPWLHPKPKALMPRVSVPYHLKELY